MAITNLEVGEPIDGIRVISVPLGRNKVVQKNILGGFRGEFDFGSKKVATVSASPAFEFKTPNPNVPPIREPGQIHVLMQDGTWFEGDKQRTFSDGSPFNLRKP
jgi:hypothetical protein